MIEQSSESNRADHEAVLAQLERIVHSAIFRRAERLCQFLRFIVVRTLDGKLEDLKETVIGIEVYGREPGYDPRAAPIVRTEARRLRAKLAEYEETAGAADPVVIRLPTGGYVPSFEFRAAHASADVVAPPTVRAPRTRWLIVGSAIAGGALVAIAIITLAVSSRRASDPYQNATVTPLTTYTGFEFAPSLSPDGRRVAFVWMAAKTGSKSTRSGSARRWRSGSLAHPRRI
jgi:serine/threonine-protein kinase